MKRKYTPILLADKESKKNECANGELNKDMRKLTLNCKRRLLMARSSIKRENTVLRHFALFLGCRCWLIEEILFVRFTRNTG